MNNPGTLSKTSETICVGGGVSVPTVYVTVNPGSKTRECSNLCSNWTEGPYPVNYTPVYWWEPEIPASFPECGVFPFVAKAKGLSQDGDCPSDTPTVDVGTFTVRVVAVTGLAPSEGDLIEGSEPPTYLVCVGTGDVVVTATPCPLDISESELPECWIFSGGQPVDSGRLRRKVSKEIPSETTFTCSAGSSSKTIKVVVWKVESVSPNISYGNTSEDRYLGYVAITVVPALTGDLPVSLRSLHTGFAVLTHNRLAQVGPPLRFVGGTRFVKVYKNAGYAPFTGACSPCSPMCLTWLRASGCGPEVSATVTVTNAPPSFSGLPVTISVPRFTPIVTGTFAINDPEGGTTFTVAATPSTLGNDPTVTISLNGNAVNWTANFPGPAYWDTTITFTVADCASKQASSTVFIDYPD